jgi:hypothetical protein
VSSDSPPQISASNRDADDWKSGLNLRIFAIAKELGIDSKQFILFCKMAGVKVKNSALASITRHERELVLAYIKQHQHLLPSPDPKVVDQPAFPVPMRPLTRRQKLYAGMCEKAHQQMLAGTCPWCGRPMKPRF